MGYQRERIFLLDRRTKGDGPRTYQKPAIATGHIPRSTQGKPEKGASPNRENLPTRSLIIHPHSKSIARTVSPSTYSIYRRQIISEFLSLTIPSIHQIARRESKIETAISWLALLPSLPDLTPALETSLLATCTAALGRIHKDPSLVHESLKFYTQGLWELQKALWEPELMYRDETLAACMTLVVYEVTECPDQTITAWLHHMKGCAKLFEVRGPESYDSEFGHLLFSSFRPLEVNLFNCSRSCREVFADILILKIQQAILERRLTYLSSPPWIHLPWKSHEKTQYDKFLDTMALLPQVIADGYSIVDTMQRAAETQTLDPSTLFVKILELVDRCWKLDAKFRAFYVELEKENLGHLYWPELSAGIITIADESGLGKVFPVAFQFLNIQMTHICMLYWASSAILWTGMVFIYKLIAGFQAQAALIQPPEDPDKPDNENGRPPIFSINQLPPLEHRVDVASLAKNICQSVEYSVQHEERAIWKTRAVAPLKVAIETFHDTPGCERELEWGLAAMESITGGGVRILGHLGGKLTDHGFLPG
jgi:hypothetical protein